MTLFQFQQTARAIAYAAFALLCMVVTFSALSLRDNLENAIDSWQAAGTKAAQAASTVDTIAADSKEPINTSLNRLQSYIQNQADALESAKTQKAMQASIEAGAAWKGTAQAVNTLVIPEIIATVRELRQSGKATLDNSAALLALLQSESLPLLRNASGTLAETQAISQKLNRALASPELSDLFARALRFVEGAGEVQDSAKQIAADLAKATSRAPEFEHEAEQLLIEGQNLLRASSQTARHGTKALDAMKWGVFGQVLIGLAGLFL